MGFKSSCDGSHVAWQAVTPSCTMTKRAALRHSLSWVRPIYSPRKFACQNCVPPRGIVGATAYPNTTPSNRLPIGLAPCFVPAHFFIAMKQLRSKKLLFLPCSPKVSIELELLYTQCSVTWGCWKPNKQTAETSIQEGRTQRVLWRLTVGNYFDFFWHRAAVNGSDDRIKENKFEAYN